MFSRNKASNIFSIHEGINGVTKSNPRTKYVFIQKRYDKIINYILLVDHIRGLTRFSILVGEKKKIYCKNRIFSLKYLRYAVRTISHDILLNIIFTDAYFFR